MESDLKIRTSSEVGVNMRHHIVSNQECRRSYQIFYAIQRVFQKAEIFA